MIYASPLENGSKAKPKILCLHGGGQTAWGFEHMKGVTDLVEALPEFEFVFASAPDPNHVWIRDPPNGKDEPTTDPGTISKSTILRKKRIFFRILKSDKVGLMKVLIILTRR